jgi:hypothetical protein
MDARNSSSTEKDRLSVQLVPGTCSPGPADSQANPCCPIRRKALDKILPYATLYRMLGFIKDPRNAEDGGKVDQKHLVVLASGYHNGVLRP